jgi:hypothetical protein
VISVTRPPYHRVTEQETEEVLCNSLVNRKMPVPFRELAECRTNESDPVIYEVCPRAPADADAAPLPLAPAGAEQNSAAAAAKR